MAEQSKTKESGFKSARAEQAAKNAGKVEPVTERTIEQAKVEPVNGAQPSRKGRAAKIVGQGGTRRMLSRDIKRSAGKVLYFVNGMIPDQEDFEKAQAIGPGVVFRNARKIVPGATLENCDFVAGPAIPPDYERVYPKAGDNAMVSSDDEENENIRNRPDRTNGGGMAPDDLRPGTVDDGIAHASGTGSGLRNPPGEQPVYQMAKEWKSNKSGNPEPTAKDATE